jgi:hypothetical protein
MFETIKSNDLKGAYLSPISHANAGNFFGNEQTEVSNRIGRFYLPEYRIAEEWK